MKMPKRLGTCADKLYAIREERLNLQKDVDKLQKDETELKNYIIDSLPKSDATGVSGKVANIKVNKTEVPQIDDWDVFFTNAKKKGNTDMLRRGFNSKAIQDRWADKKVVPGVKAFTKVSVSCTKIPTK